MLRKHFGEARSKSSRQQLEVRPSRPRSFRDNEAPQPGRCRHGQSLYSAPPVLLRAIPRTTTPAPRAYPMKEYEQEDPIPQGDLALQLTALPRETNGFGDIYGGWLVSQMDLAGTAMASRVASGRVATVSIDRMAFMVPVAVGAQLSFYTQTLDVGRSSIRMLVEVWSDDPVSSEWRKVTEAVFVFVAIDSTGRTRSVTPRR